MVVHSSGRSFSSLQASVQFGQRIFISEDRGRAFSTELCALSTRKELSGYTALAEPDWKLLESRVCSGLEGFCRSHDAHGMFLLCQKLP